MTVNPNRRIKLTWATSNYVMGTDDGYRVRIDVECAEGMSEKIFAYRLLPKNPGTGEKVGWFSHVCSPPDLEEYPEDEPIPTHVPEWFRLNYVDIFVRSPTEAAAFIDDVISDANRLKNSLDVLDTVEPAGAEDVGGDGFCPGTPSDSSGSSVSSSSSSDSIGAGVRIVTGTFENQAGEGMDWEQIGTGAGSPVGSSDSLGMNYQRVYLPWNQVSKVLLIQGYPLDSLPADAIIDGIIARLVIRKYGEGSSSSSSSSSSSAGTPDGARLYFLRLLHPDQGWVGDNKANNDVIVGPEWNTITFGGASDTWNAGLDAATLKRGGFGVGLVLGNTHDIKDCLVDVDGVELEIYFRG